MQMARPINGYRSDLGQGFSEAGIEYYGARKRFSRRGLHAVRTGTTTMLPGGPVLMNFGLRFKRPASSNLASSAESTISHILSCRYLNFLLLTVVIPLLPTFPNGSAASTRDLRCSPTLTGRSWKRLACEPGFLQTCCSPCTWLAS